MAVAVRLTSSAAPDETADLFERYSERIHAYCLHVLRDRTEADDAVQTTFLNAHRALQRGVTPMHEYAWLHTIAKNVCRTQQRTKRRRAPLAEVDVDTIPGQEDGDAGELKAVLAEALTHLPESQRRAVVLREWHGLTPQEIAPRLGLSVPATHALLTRARRSLANALTTTLRAPLVVFDLSGVADVLRGLKGYLGGAATKTAVAAAVMTTSVGIGGGVIVERSLRDRPTDVSSTPPSASVSQVASSSAGSASLSSRPADARPTLAAHEGATRMEPSTTPPTMSGVTTPTQEGNAPAASEPTASGEAVLPPSPDVSSPAPDDPLPVEPPGLPDLPPPVEEVVDAATTAVEDPPLPPLPPLPELPSGEEPPPPPDLPPLPSLP